MKPAIQPLELARGLLAAVMVALLFSPPVTALFELALYALMIGSAELRARLVRAVRQPLGAMALVFWAVVALGLAYSIAPASESLGIWFSWRRLLLLVIGLALFDDPAWKRRIAIVLVVVATLCALASYFVTFFDITIRHYLPGVVLRTHSFQGMIFTVAAFAAALLMRDPAVPSRARLLLGAACVLLVLNIAFITPGRSGYAVLVVLAIALGIALLKNRQASGLKRLAWGGGAALLVLALLASSPVVRQRIELGLAEIESYEQGTAISSMGERVVYMRNALQLIAERPLIGHGTGAFATAYARLVEGRSGREGLKIHDPHNQFLNIAAQHGLLGLAVFLVLLGSAFGRRCSAPHRLMGLSVLAAWCVTSLFSSHFSTFAEGRFIWLWLGVWLARD